MSDKNQKVVAGSIRTTVRNKILQLVSQIPAQQKIVLLDSNTVKIVDSCVSMPDILDSGVFLLENVSIGRQPYPKMSAIYIVEPQGNVIEMIGKDFTPPSKKLASGRTGAMYSEAHLFFVTTVPQDLMNKLAQSPVAPYVKSFQELYLDFIPMESRFFHLKVEPSFFGTLYAPMIPDGPESPILSSLLDELAMKIATACVTMGELPRVRYRKAPGDFRSQKLAIRVQQKLDELSKKVNLREIGGSGKVSTLLIVDRTLDLLAPLLHEFTLQAMANDLIGLGPDGTRFEYSYATITGIQRKAVSLDEKDSLWCTLRHAHIADCSTLIIERFNKFLNENKAAIKSRKTSTTNDVTSLSELKETMAALGEFQEMKSEYALHLSLAQDCLAASDKKKMINVAGLEQNMATGVDPSGSSIKESEVWSELVQKLSDTTLTSEEKTRLVLIYLLTNPKLGEMDRRALFDHAKLRPNDQSAIKQMLILSEGRSYRQRPSNRPKSSKRHSCLDDSPQYDVSRFIPAVKVVLEDLANEELDVSEFPYIKSEGSSSIPASPMERAAPLSLRSKSTPMAPSSSSTTGPIFVFMLGGCSYSEVRSVYELSDSLKKDFYIGSDGAITPEMFLQRLSSI